LIHFLRELVYYFIMDQMLLSPLFSIPSIGSPPQALDEDHMIAPQAQEAQEQPSNSSMYTFGGFTPQDMLSTGQTPQEILSTGQTPQDMLPTRQTPQNMLSTGHTPQNMLGCPPQSLLSSGTGGPLEDVPMYAPVVSPAPLTPGLQLQQPTTDIVPQLVNIVSTVNMCCRLDLKKIAQHARNAEYNPKKFAGVVMRIREPKGTAMIFASGKMVCTGAKSEEESRLAARKFARIVQKLGFEARFKNFKIRNIVGTCDVKFPIRLEGLALAHSQFSNYAPELHPGLVYRMAKPKVVMMIFFNGKVTLLGAKVREEIYEAFDNIYPVLKNFKKQ